MYRLKFFVFDWIKNIKIFPPSKIVYQYPFFLELKKERMLKFKLMGKKKVRFIRTIFTDYTSHFLT